MKSIIEDIIEIDSIAQKRIDEAQKIRDEISNQIKLEKEQLNSDLNERAEARIVKIENTEKTHADEQKAKIAKETEEKISKLTQSFDGIKEKLEKEIYQNVIK